VEGSLLGACGSTEGSTPVFLGSIGRHDEEAWEARTTVPSPAARTASKNLFSRSGAMSEAFVGRRRCTMFALKPFMKRTSALRPWTEMPFGWMPEEFERYFRPFFTGWPVAEAPEWEYPWGMTTEETEKGFVVRVEVPGFEPEELKVEVTPERLTVEAEHKEPAEKGEKKEERTYAKVRREVTLPLGVETEKAEATYRSGVLEVRVPRKPEALGRRVEVKT